MSKRSKERRRRLAAEQAARESGQLPIIGNFEQRATQIIKQDNPDIKPDSRLPVHYGGNGHYVSNGPLIGYRTIDKVDEKQTFNVKSSDIVTGECPIAKIPKVYVTTRLWNEWIALAEDYDTEWFAYLTGQFVKDDKGPRYEIRKMYFPPQTAHAAHVDVDDDFEGYLPNTIGAIHSHVGMGVFFSGEDLAHSNWPVEIVVNNKGEVKVMIRHQLDCGNWIKNYSEVLTVGDNADSRYTAALDKAFLAGEGLKQQRIAKSSKDIGYRTPDVRPAWMTDYKNPPSSTPTMSYDNNQEWHFRINGKPMRWRSDGKGSGEYVEVIKVDGKWLDIDDPSIEVVTQPDVPDATGNSQDVTGSIEIDDKTGQITMVGDHDDGSNDQSTRPATQEELDRLLESEVDAASCFDCGGTGRVTANGANIECTGCGGSGLKPEYKMGMGWEGGC